MTLCCSECFCQIKNSKSNQSALKDRISQEKQIDTFLNRMNYEEIKSKISERGSKEISTAEFTKRVSSIDENKMDLKQIENIMLDLYSFTNSQLAELYRTSRLQSLGKPNKELDVMSDNYFKQIDETFNENALLVALNPTFQPKHNAVVKSSFPVFFENLVDNAFEIAECLVCCPKSAFPNQRIFFLKPRYGTTITNIKAEYSQWYSHKLCGFMISNFPITFKKVRFRLNLQGLLMYINGLPRFRNLSPYGTDVYVSMIPTVLVLGLSDLSIPPCQNDAIKKKLLSLVQVSDSWF